MRWIAAGVTVLAVASVPTALAGVRDTVTELRGSDAGRSDAATLLHRALGSSVVPYAGLAESRGTLGLPDVAALGDVSSLLSSTTRTRIWWATPSAWRVDVLTAAGEHGTYAAPDDPRHSVVTWNYASGALTTVRLGDGQSSDIVRLPRADDLIPPALGRRLLAGVTALDRLTVADSNPLAGRRTTRLEVRPGDPQSTIGAVVLRLDTATALPLQVDIRNRAGQLVLTTRFDSVSMSRPAASVLRPPDPPGAHRAETSTPDLAARADRRFTGQLPRSLAGIPVAPRLGGVATYGTGFARFVVVPLSPRTSRQVVTALTGRSVVVKLVGGSGNLVTASLLNALLVTGADSRAYVIAGPVSAELLEHAGQDLLSRPRGFG